MGFGQGCSLAFSISTPLYEIPLITPHSDETPFGDDWLLDQSYSSLDDDLLYDKEVRREQHNKKKEKGRRNRKEKRRISWLKKQAKLSKNISPHSDEFDVFEFLNELKKSLPENLVDSFGMNEIENVSLLCYSLYRSRNASDLIVHLMSFIKMHTSKSLFSMLLNVLDDEFEDNSEDIDVHSWSMSDVKQKWTLLKTNSVFTKVSFLITAAMSLSVCTVKKLEWSPMGVKIISLEAARQQVDAADIIDALIFTLTWVSETGYQCMEEKSLLPLLYSNNEMRVFNEQCDYVLANAEQILAGNGELVQDFEHKVDETLRKVSELKSLRSDGSTSLWLQSKYSELVDIKYKIVAKYRNTAIRFAPFGVGITGPSGVGKSTLSKLTMKTALHAMGFETDPKRIITKDMFDKYDSTYTSDILGMFMDDVGNGKSDFTQTSPTDVIIKFFNNMAAQAVKAELNSKGVVFIGFKVGVLTSNHEDYDVSSYTNKPEAALRRFIHCRARVKPHLRIQGGVSLNTDHPDVVNATSICNDVWELDLEECFVYEYSPGKETYKFRIMEVKVGERTILCKNLNLEDYLTVIVELSKRHKKKQTNVVTQAQDFDSMYMCSTCSKPQPLCNCVVPHGFEDLGEMIFDSVKNSFVNYMFSLWNPLCYFYKLFELDCVRSFSTEKLSLMLESSLYRKGTPFLVSVIPSCLYETYIFSKVTTSWAKATVHYDLAPVQRRFNIFLCLMSLFFSYYTLWSIVYSVFVYMFSSVFFWYAYSARVEACRKEYLTRRDALPASLKRFRDGNYVKGALAISALVFALKAFQIWRKKCDSSIVPDGISKEDMENSPSWFGFMMQKLGAQVKVTSETSTAHADQVRSTLEKGNLFWAEFRRSDGSMTRCNIFFPRKSVAFFPEHVFYPGCDMSSKPTDLLCVRVFRHDRPGGVFEFKCELETSVISKDHDLVCVYVPNCPDLRDKLKWLPITKPTGSAICEFMCRSEDNFVYDKVSVKMMNTSHKYKRFYGGQYNSALAKPGACMGVLILCQQQTTLAGFHIGGDVKQGVGRMQTITKGEAMELIRRLELIPGVIVSSSATSLPVTQYGKPLIVSQKVHPQSMVAKLTSHDYVDVIGSTELRMSQKSQVTTSVLSEAVADICGVQNIWGAPKLLPNWKGYNATLEHIVNPADMFAPSKLEKARQDWLAPLAKEMEIYSKEEDFRPLNDRECVLGVPGKRFLDALKMDTGMGFPVFGPKNRYFEEIRDGDVLVDRIPCEEVLKEVSRLNDCWLRGERAYPVTTATLKDEPTPLEKEKVRVFQAAAVAFSLQIRKYFLPIARFLSLHPELSECAVGVNAFSDQWDQLIKHAQKYSEDDMMIAWDYSKYDVRMNSQMTRCVLSCFVDLASLGGYDATSIFIMKNMIADMVHPLIDYNGSMIMAYNMNTSGNNITVNINSVAGSLYVRLGFFDKFPNEADFRSKVSALTYGDDFIGSVREDFRDFNFYSFQSFLKDHGMKVTLPDKSDNSSAFLHKDEVDFLKRKSKYIPEINTSIGALDENSIFKSLHSNLKSKGATREQVAASCIETAMHEWFAHGRDVYEKRQKQMQQVIKRVSLPVPAVDCTYDERVQFWLEKYADSS